MVDRPHCNSAVALRTLTDFLRASRQAKYDAQTENSEDLRNFCKKVGWNLVFAGWNLAEASGAPQAAAPFAKASEAKPPCGSGVRPPPISVPRGGSAARAACPNPPQNGPFSCVADPEAPFVPILPQDVAAYLPAAKIFRSLGSKTDPILHIQFTRLWGIVARNRGAKKWRSYLDRVQTAVLGEK